MKGILIATLILPLLYIIIGTAGFFFPPRTINHLRGYRTRRAKLSQDTWDYANHSFSIVCLFMGIYTLFATAFFDALIKSLAGTVQLILGFSIIWVQLILVFIPIYYTENQLRFIFDEDGRYVIPPDPRDDEEEKKEDEEWENWKKWPDENEEKWEEWSNYDENWVDWKTWVHQRDVELFEERLNRMKEAPEGRQMPGEADTDNADQNKKDDEVIQR